MFEVLYLLLIAFGLGVAGFIAVSLIDFVIKIIILFIFDKLK